MSETQHLAAKTLLDIGAIHINTDVPFTHTSGRLSPVYVDCRKPVSFVEERRLLVMLAVDVLKRQCDISKIDYIAGGETAGIPWAAWIAEALSKPMLYVRKKPKGFGRLAQIEGDMAEGANVLLVEDMTTDGASKITFAKVLRDAGADVTDVFSLFFYDIFPNSVGKLREEGLTLHYLATWQDILDYARLEKKVDAESLLEVERYLADPEGWSQQAEELRA